MRSSLSRPAAVDRATNCHRAREECHERAHRSQAIRSMTSLPHERPEVDGCRTVVLDGKHVQVRTAPDVVALHYREPAFHQVRALVADRIGLGSVVDNRVEIPGEAFTLYPTPHVDDEPTAA